MPTEAQKERIRAEVARLIGVETNEAFAKRAGVDPQTLGDFLAGRRWPRRATLDKIEAGLRLTRGTLAALGEDRQPDVSPHGMLRSLSDADLVNELGYRLAQLRREASEAPSESGG